MWQMWKKQKVNKFENKKKQKTDWANGACRKTQSKSTETVVLRAQPSLDQNLFDRCGIVSSSFVNSLIHLLCRYWSCDQCVVIFQNEQKNRLTGITPQIRPPNITSPPKLHITSPTFCLRFLSVKKECRAGVRCLWHRLFISQQIVAPVSGF